MPGTSLRDRQARHVVNLSKSSLMARGSWVFQALLSPLSSSSPNCCSCFSIWSSSSSSTLQVMRDEFLILLIVTRTKLLFPTLHASLLVAFSMRCLNNPTSQLEHPRGYFGLKRKTIRAASLLWMIALCSFPMILILNA